MQPQASCSSHTYINICKKKKKTEHGNYICFASFSNILKKNSLVKDENLF